METKTQLRKATRQKALLRLGLSGPSGSGKTVSALILAYGITGDWAKIALIDTENGSADLYANHTLPGGFKIGEFNVLPITAPYHPKKYIDSIKTCEQAGMEVIIIDSITHEWNGKGGCLDLHEQETAKMKIPNSFTSWAKITPLHQAFIDSILQSTVHVITAVRSKTDYVLAERGGKQVPQKVGMAQQTRDGFEYELTLSLDIDLEHKAFVSKDRTGLFTGKPPEIITPETGKTILAWCKSGVDPIPNRTNESAKKEFETIFEIEDELKACKTYEAQTKFWNSLSEIDRAKPIVINLFKDNSLKPKTKTPIKALTETLAKTLKTETT